MLACKPSLQISSALNSTVAYKSTVPYPPLFLQSTIPFLPKHRLEFRDPVFEFSLTKVSRGAWPRDAYDLGTMAAVRASLDERKSVLDLSHEASSAAVSKDMSRWRASQ